MKTFPRAIGCLALIGLFFSTHLLRPAGACTTAVVSGRVTADGRPMLWKNRDTKAQHNCVLYSTRGKYAYVAVVNAGSTSVWMGVNEKGFCIENSVVKDLPRGDKPGMGNGEFMRHALATCATLQEFEALLDRTNKTGRRTQANFGAIDANGGAAIFETGHVSHVKFDANDPSVAPQGYVVRSNFSMTGTGHAKLQEGGDLNDIYSGGRYLRGEALFAQAGKTGKLDHRYILRHCSRDLADEQCRPLPGSINGEPGVLPPAIDTTSTICRRTTVSVGVFHGVRPGEDPRLTTLWVMLGEPAFAVALPCWVAAEGVAPDLKGDKRSPLCSTTIALRNAHYDPEGQLLQTARLPDVWMQTWKLEDTILRETEQQLARWRRDFPGREEVAAFHRAMAKRTQTLLSKLQEQYAPPVPVGSSSEK